MELRTVLVANRGEIAVRIVRSCRELGLRSVAVYSDADDGALHVRLADEAHRIGPPPARQSYLDVDAVLGAAKASGADAVHPGYGLLSEDAGFAAAVADAGLIWVGPPAATIARMGDKVAARALAQACGVPVPPGGGPEDAERIGWPLVVKASFGGGGRGMRVARSPADLADALAAAGREASAAFGRGEVHLERYLEGARHVEVQVLGDLHGTVVVLGDRDCSVQRRHQKLIEEAPAPDLSPTLRSALHDAALRVTRGYVGAGTVEFLVLGSGEFFFLEMNTRLQVEHGVTELVTGLDLVAWQLRIAGGEPLGLGEVPVRGHAIQARVAAEDPWEGFRPAPGRITALDLPSGPGIRVDAGVTAGAAVPAEYDSLFAKVLAWGADRESARRRLLGALAELRVDGLPTTAPYLRGVLASASFTAATHDTGSVEREWPPDPAARPAASVAPAPPLPAALASTTRRVRFVTDRGPVEVAIPVITRTAAAPARPARTDTSTTATEPGGPPVAPMDGTVVAVPVAVGQAVAAGDVLAVVEAMKMELPVRAAGPGVVAEVFVVVGRSVSAGSVVVRIEP